MLSNRLLNFVRFFVFLIRFIQQSLAFLRRTDLAQRTIALVLLLALVLPTIFIGQVQKVSANTFPINPTIEMPAILLAPPEPFQPSSTVTVGSFLNIWDDIYSWFDSQAEDVKVRETVVEPLQTTNYALGMPSEQSTTWVGIAARANDGNTSGDWNNNSVTHTAGDVQPWWQVDLGQLRQIGTIKIWNRTDCCPERLSNFYLLVSDNPFTSGNLAETLAQSGVSAYQITNTVNVQTQISVNRSGRYVRVQLINQDYLSLAEVEVFGSSSNSNPTANLSRARLSPKNQTGGTNLYSRNFGWGTGLAGLPGRGLDAGFGISYNSLIWLKDGSNIVFNPNNDNITPGFRFGFPVVEPNYTDPLTGKNTHLMVTPSGARVEFRQVDGSTDTFETADSSYIQLKKVDASNLTITGTDGTNAYYQLKNGAFYCASVKDANGNFITVNHDTNGRLQSVTDTLGRVINVNYDGQGSPVSITQARSTGTYTFATFTYTTQTINPNFSGLNLVGITNGTNIKVLQRIYYPDGGFTQFDYNSFGQVWWIRNFAADQHQLNYTAINFANESQAQTDCPRFGLIRNWTENFNLNTSGQPVEVSTYINQYQENQSFTPPGGTAQTGTWVQILSPDGVYTNNFFGSSGWREGLPLMTEDWTNDGGTWNRRRWSWTNYTQDNPNLSYILNPRTIEAKVGDPANTKRTTIEYHTQAGNPQASQWGLVKEVVQYDADQNTPLQRVHTEYNFDTQYSSRRILGVVADVRLSDQNNALMSRVTYQYDEGNFAGAGQTISPIQHDTANYGASYTYRGNLTSTTRWDATDAFNASKAITSRVKYNTAGNPVSSTDPLNREIKTSYNDSFDDNVNRNTFAYPTQITDPANNSSTVKYRFDYGANVYAQSPAPAGQSVGKQTSRIYDALGRLEKEIVLNTGAYIRYEYPANGIQSRVFSTITDVNGNGADAADEVLSEAFTDGAGRVRQSRSEHPGSAGGWSATLTEYDIMGRVKRSTVPTEINASWQPSGDDAAKGWTWTAQEYDWKGRVTRQINVDGTDKLFSYEGCGCAGGQVTTVSGEQLAEGRRRQKVYEDILGRTYKTEVLNWDGSVYSTSKSFFNGRDQVTLARQYAGADNSSTYQDTTMTYDGYGRLKTQHRPEQNAGTVTTYNYYADDRIQQVVDARGATSNYSYDNRGLTTQVSTTSPNPSTIPITPTVTYNYDNLGNPTLMTDGLGNVTYEYNQLSQLTAEVRQFNDSLPNAPTAGNKFRIQYGYSFSGQLSSITDPYGQQINYAFDKIGRLNQVNGSTPFDGVTNYANSPAYRAWGALKSLNYGSGLQMTMNFNNRLQADNYNLTFSGSSIMNRNYQYYQDGGFKYMQDVLIPKFDRLQIYDHLGRIKEAKTGAEARGQTVQNPINENLPYRQSFQYDAFSNMTARYNLQWGRDIWEGQTFNLLNAYSPNTNRNISWGYDADGRATYSFEGDEVSLTTFDTGGNFVKQNQEITRSYQGEFTTMFQVTQLEINRFLDGNGRELKRLKKDCIRQVAGVPCQMVDNPLQYSIRSSVFGNETLTEVNATGKKLKTYVKASGATIAWQTVDYSSGSVVETIRFENWDASGMSRRFSFKNGGVYYATETEDQVLENDPLGGNAGMSNPYVEEEPSQPGGGCPECNNQGIQPTDEWSTRGANGQRVSYSLDGIRISAALAQSILESGMVGGQFGLLEQQARRSAQAPQKIGEWWRTTTWSTSSDTEVHTFTNQSKLSDVYADSSWAINWAMIPAEQQTKQYVTYKRKKYEVIADTYKKDLKTSFDARVALTQCKKALDALLSQLGSKYKTINDVYATVDKDQGFLQTIKPLNPSAAAFATVEKGKMKVVANSDNRNYPDEINYINNLYGTETRTLIHELLHLAKGNDTFTHTELATAMLATSIFLGDPPITLTMSGKDFSNPSQNTEGQNSDYMNRWILNYCPAIAPPRKP